MIRPITPEKWPIESFRLESKRLGVFQTTCTQGVELYSFVQRQAFLRVEVVVDAADVDGRAVEAFLAFAQLRHHVHAMSPTVCVPAHVLVVADL